MSELVENASISARITQLWIYPVKSCAGIPLQNSELSRQCGAFRFDRQWMIATPPEDTASAPGSPLVYKFVTGRRSPITTMIQPYLDINESTSSGTLSLSLLGSPGTAYSADDPVPPRANPASNHFVLKTRNILVPVDVDPLMSTGGPPVVVKVWRDDIYALDLGDAVSDWLTAVLGYRARLLEPVASRPSATTVHVQRAFSALPRASPTRGLFEKTLRCTAGNRTPGTGDVLFADAFPFLLLSEESLRDLSKAMDQHGWSSASGGGPVVTDPVRRLRPNIVVSHGGAPWSEDAWHSFTLGGDSKSPAFAALGVKTCTRCKMTNIEPLRGIAAEFGSKAKGDCLFVMSQLGRCYEKGIIAGLNALLVGAAGNSLAVGQSVHVTSQWTAAAVLAERSGDPPADYCTTSQTCGQTGCAPCSFMASLGSWGGVSVLLGVVVAFEAYRRYSS